MLITRAESFAKLLSHDSVSELSAKDFDPKGQYKDVVEAVEKVVDGKPKIFRTETEGARVQYWVVGVKKGGGSLVGVRAKAVES